MKNTIPSQKWLRIFAGIFATAVLVLGMTAYWIDPFYQFRYTEAPYFNNTAKFPGPGLVKHYPYDTLILGSSMTQNFDMDVFHRELGAEALHIGIGGMGMEELLSYIELSEHVGKCESYYIGIDQYMLTEPVEYRTPDYLFRDDPVSMLRYLFSYEAWFRYIPLDVALSVINRLPVSLPEKLQRTMHVDNMGNWENDFPIGEEYVIRNYLRDEYGVSSVETEGLYGRMTAWTDKLFENLPGDRSRYHFFFPPYSVLFWYDAEKDGYFDVYMDAKQYFLEQAQKYGVEVYDFQSADFVFDLNQYKDITHYRGEINDWMVSCFATGDYRADPESLSQSRAKLEEGISAFAGTFDERINRTAGTD